VRILKLPLGTSLDHHFSRDQSVDDPTEVIDFNRNGNSLSRVGSNGGCN
jgi:hypothetical protein